jgi:hypothetical protein
LTASLVIAAVGVATLRARSAAAMTTPAQMVQRHAFQLVPPSETASTTASCTAGEQLLGGGYYVAADFATAQASYPSSGTSWTATFHNTTVYTVTMNAFADW